MTFDATITLGNVIELCGILAALISLGYKAFNRFTAIEELLKVHTTTLSAHNTRMERYEDRMIDLAGDVQRLVGIIQTREQRFRAGNGDDLGNH